MDTTWTKSKRLSTLRSEQEPSLSQDDARLEYIRRHVIQTFPGVKVDALNHKLATNDVATMIFDFLHAPNVRLLLFTDHGDELKGVVDVYTTPPANLLGATCKNLMTVLYLIKTAPTPVSTTNFHDEIMPGTLENDALESLALLLHDVFLPLIRNPRNQQMWPELVTTSIVNHMHAFDSTLQITLGQSKGVTCLPLPWEHVGLKTPATSFEDALTSKEQMDLSTVSNFKKDQVHMMESCLITWTKQIKQILTQDSEPDRNYIHHGPMEELRFWNAKAKTLNSIFAQLQSDSIRKVLQDLEASKSTYNVPFAKLCKEVVQAKAEANDNKHYLRPLFSWFEQLENAQTLLEIRDLFRPICHSILLIWKSSQFYNTPTRLVVMIRQICNAIIKKATMHINGQKLFELIDGEEFEQANRMLQLPLQVCTLFKSVYIEYKAKSVTEVSNNPWQIQDNVLFVRLDAFLERCDDALELTKTVKQFQKLAQMEIGGTKGKTLTTSVRQIYTEFLETFALMKNARYDLMDLDAEQFENDFYTFRMKNKELERRLASVINQAFDDAKTIAGQFKCLDSFKDLLDRPIIKIELERKYISLITSYASDVHIVQQIFIENRKHPPIPPNFPPFAGAVTWCRGLGERIQYPMEKLTQVLPKLVLDCEDLKEAVKLFRNVKKMLDGYEIHMVKQWEISIETSSNAKLKLPLMRREPGAGSSESSHLSVRLLYVNFDAALVQLLREAKYFVLLRLEIPEDALEIYKRAEVFRRQTGNLELIVDMYNTIHTTLLPVEKPLVNSCLERMDQVLNKGIKALNWKSHGIDIFLKESLTVVNEANTLLNHLKSHQNQVTEILDNWNAAPLLFERKSKTLPVKEFEEFQKTLYEQKLHMIREGGNEIHRLLKDTLKYLRVAQGSPDWKAYVDYVSHIVEDGLAQVILQSLGQLREQLDPKRIESEDISALIEVELDLYGKNMVYSPSIQAMSDKTGVEDVIMRQVEAILHCSTVFKRLDSSEGSYLKEMQENTRIQLLIADIWSFLDYTKKACIAFSQALTKYEFLWTTDLPQMFQEFLLSAWSPYPYSDQSNSGFTYADSFVSAPSSNPKPGAAAEKRSVTKSTVAASLALAQPPPMPVQLLHFDSFQEKIAYFLGLQNEILGSKHMKDVGFLRVNSLPIKQALSTWVTKWIFLFTQYLYDRVIHQLVWIYNFMQKVNAGLDMDIDTEDPEKVEVILMQSSLHIHDVRYLLREKVLVNFAPVNDFVALLKANGISFDMVYVGKENILAFLEQAPLRWDNLVNKTFKRKEAIQSLQDQRKESIQAEVAEFKKRLVLMKEEFKIAAPLYAPPDSRSIVSVYGRLDAYNAKLVEVEQEGGRLMELEDLFEIVSSKFEILTELRTNFVNLKHIWDVVALLNSIYLNKWQSLLWNELNVDDLMDEMNEVDRHWHFMLPSTSAVKEWPIYKYLEQKVHQMTVVLPLIKLLRTPAVHDRHWKTLMGLSKQLFELPGHIKVQSFRLEEVLKLELFRYVNEVNELMETAAKEFKIEQQLHAIETAWNGFQLEFVPYRTAGSNATTGDDQSGRSNLKSVRESGTMASSIALLKTTSEQEDDNVLILKMPNVILETLEEHQLLLQTMAATGKSVAYFKTEISEWLMRLGNVDTILKLWIALQRQWCSLESIFLSSGGDIQHQLPSEYQRFEYADRAMKTLYAEARMAPSVLFACSEQKGRETVLQNLQLELEICQKALNQYLDGKKDIFPRFYFVSNASLLEILSNGNHPPHLQPHFEYCFDGVQSFTFTNAHSRSTLTILSDTNSSSVSVSGSLQERFFAEAMVSKQGEVVEFVEPHLIHGNVENWLNDLVRVMQNTLRHEIFDAVESSALWTIDCARHEWVFKYPAQVAVLASQIVWTAEVESAFEEFENGSEDAITKYYEVLTARLEELIKLVQGQLEALDRQKIITLITVDVHARDVVQSLTTKAQNASDFQWQSQLRYYTSSGSLKKEVEIQLCDFHSFYSHEYTGNCGRLVITPLTDRCYVTLTTALRLCLGGAPAGPAGTGKTETTKDLARGMGLQCYVFNCSDQMNYISMANIFRGLAQTGAWGCFDEFNRISVEVMSVVATQVKTVLDATALKVVSPRRSSTVTTRDVNSSKRTENFQQTSRLDFFGKVIALVPTVGFFITMNPGYAGRAELPENLKALFRSCAMIKPDLQPICENMLMAEGFLKARKLSLKFVTLYELCSELLSKQKHYDWGLRSVKSVLLVAGSLRRAYSTLSEETVLMQVLRDFNTPRILAFEHPIFMSLLGDLFPNQVLASHTNATLEAKCARICTHKKLQPEDEFVKKIMEFDEVLKVRHSVMLIGPAGCGKSTVWKTLAACHNADDAGNPLSKHLTAFESINPKAITADELYGYVTLENDWKDGVLSSIMRNMSKNLTPFSEVQTYKWIVLDGDIDAVWIESMNTVMDDNKVLTLVSNERIPLTRSMRLVFEISSLINATPATVSRAGIIYMDYSRMSWSRVVESWLQQRDSTAEARYLPDLFKKYTYNMSSAHEATKTETIVPLLPIAMIEMLCRLLDSQLSLIDEQEKTPEVLENAFIYCGLWAFGGALSSEKGTDARATFSTHLKTFVKYKVAATTNAATMTDSANLFDFYYDITQNELVSWKDQVPATVPTANRSLSALVVPTMESTRVHSIVDLLLQKKNPILLVGPSGSGKSSFIHEHLKGLDDAFTFAYVNMHHYMDAQKLQTCLEQFIEKKSGRVFGPLTNRKLVYILDDLNMPFVDEFGTQPALALLRQYMDYTSWYDRHDLSMKKGIRDVQFLASMNPTAGSFVINPRLHRHFSTLCLSLLAKDDLTTIYSTLLNLHLTNFTSTIQKLASSILTATMELHAQVRATFLPTATNFHYAFNMHGLSALFQGILMTRPESNVSSRQFCRLWIHECFRVWSDRMSSSREVRLFTEIAVEQTRKHLKEDQAEIFAHPLICVNFLNSESTSMEGDTSLNYAPITEKTQLTAFLERKLAEYNETHPVMPLVLFDQALEHVTRIARILASPRGNALLIGVGGSGKQSLSRLAAFICGYTLVSLTTSASPSYTMSELKEDLKEISRKAGIRPAKPIVLLVTDAQILENRFLLPLTEALTCGYFVDLFSSDEMEAMTGSLRMEAKMRGISDTKEHLQEFLNERIRNNLHLILAFSPVGSDLRIRCRTFPSLVNCCTIDWFHPWPKEALVDVSMKFLQDVPLSSREIQENVCHHMAEMHMSVTTACTMYAKVYRRHNYVTPTSFLELIRFYRSLLEKKRALQNLNINRLKVGLATLKKTSLDVAGLQMELQLKVTEVEERKKAADVLLDQMGKQRGEAEEKQQRADAERVKAAQAAEIASQIETQASTELLIAKPALDAAQQAVQGLSKASLTELKSMGKPPAGVEKVTAAVLMMVKKETKNFSWENAKKMMAKVDVFKASLEQYDKENIPPDVVARVEPFIKEDPNFNYDKMKSKSLAAANLCVWVVNIISFHRIFVRVKPLMDRLEQAREVKTEADNELAGVLKITAEVEAQLNALQASFRDATNEKATVEAEAQTCQERLLLAERLVNGLTSENERWSHEIELLHAGESALIGDSLLAAGFVSYLGAFNANFRARLWKNTWLRDIVTHGIPTTLAIVPSDGVDMVDNTENKLMGDPDALVNVLSDSSDVAQWMNEGLPADRISIENGCILTSCQRWPLLVDPQLQGLTWLRGHNFRHKKTEGLEEKEEESQALIMLQTSQKNWIMSLKRAITKGENVILENLGETIEASVEPVIKWQIHKKGGHWFLQFAAEEIQVDARFRLYLHTKLPNPHYRPETLAYCTLIDFSVTEKGLEDQLLASVVKLEQPDLERQKCRLEQAFNGYQIQLNQLERDLLDRLSNAPDDILSDVSLIEDLEKTKRMVLDVESAFEKGKATESEINRAREVYRPVANEASMMYFLMNQLCKVNHMYRYSLELYMTFFFMALKGTAPSSTNASGNESESLPVLDRVEKLKVVLRWTIFSMVSRGLFEEHKLLFLTQLVFLLLRRGFIGATSGYQVHLARFLLQGSKLVGPDNPIKWLTESQWQSLQALITFSPFETFVSDLEASEPRFREWYTSSSPEVEKLPLDWRELDKTAPFLKLLVIKCLRPDRLTQAISNFILQTLPNGSHFLHCDTQLNSFSILKKAFEESSPWTPMYFLLSPGSDVVADVDTLAMQDQARRKGVDYHNIALGQGQEERTMRTLEVSVEKGHWVILNNVHLMPKWMLELDKWLEQLIKKASNTVPSAPLSSGNEHVTLLQHSPSLSLLATATRDENAGNVHSNFRLFITSDASTDIPIGILERSIKLTNEPPTGLRANVKRALCCFSQEVVDELEPRTRCILFALCYFHSLMVERKKFGPYGFNMMYPFAPSDLVASSTVLRNYMDNAPGRVPWPDLRYLFGEIMYGGHIVNELDRLVAMTYLDYFLRDELLDEMGMLPFGDIASGSTGKRKENGSNGGDGGETSSTGGSPRREFLAPKLSAGFDRMLEHVHTSLLNESPTAFGLHPNAEVAFRTESAHVLMQSMLLLTSKEEDGHEDGSHEDVDAATEGADMADTVQLAVEGLVQDLLETYRDFRIDIPEEFVSASSSLQRHKDVASETDGMNPFQTVLLQECQCVNYLLETMTTSLLGLELAFHGDVPLTDVHEKLQTSLYYERVPTDWLVVSCPSRRSLAPWLATLQQRIAQLQEWIGTAPELPLVLWLPGLLNPQALLAAVLQTAAHKENVELDSLGITVDVTKETIDTVDAPARDGLFVHGLYLEGARWDFTNRVLETSLPREMFVSMPVLTCRAIAKSTSKGLSSASKSSNVFECPVYRTQQRGSTLIFMSPLRTNVPPAKWVLAGVAMLMEVV